MHITIINQFYWPHHAATSQLMTELAEELVRRGDKVTVITATVGTDEGITPLNEVREGVRILRVPTTRRGKGSIVSRLVDYSSFFAGALARLATLSPRPDVVMPLTTPPWIAAGAVSVGFARSYPTVALVEDLYPDIAVALGVLPKNGAVHRLWSAVQSLSLRSARRVIVLSTAMRQRVLEYGVADDRIAIIHNWALEELDRPVAGESMRLRYGFGDRFVVMYSGNMGAGHEFDTLLDAAERLKHREDIVFAFVGDGVRRAAIAARADTLDNVHLFPYAPRDVLAQSLASADVHVVTMRGGFEGLLMPSKLYGILAAGRPTLFIGPRTSAVTDVVERGECGVAIELGDVDSVVEHVTRWASDRAHAAQVGAAARECHERHYQRSIAVDAYIDVLRDAAQSEIQSTPRRPRRVERRSARGQR